MIKRSRREHCLQLCEQNPDWNTLDLGCGRDGIKLVNVYADIENYESDYPGKRFVQTVANDTPFEDKEFDFVFCNHIAEHVTDPAAFCKELVRISKRGFIEVPMPFFDNLVVGNSNPPPHGHVWWVTYDDVTDQVVFKPRKAIVEELAIPADTTFLLPFFRESMILELYWEDSIDIRIDEPVFSYVAGNSDKPRVVDLTGKVIPSNVQKWRPKLL